MKVLHALSSVDPRGGGPLEGVRQRGLKLQQLGHTVEVVTLDDPDLSFVAEFPLKVHALGPSLGSYRYNKQLVPWLKANAPHFDAVVVNGLWQYHSFGVWRALHTTDVPYVVFTHGMLDPWFKRAYPLKHIKKALYWPWADYRVLRDAAAVLFTSEEERLQARRSFARYRAKEHVVAYGTNSPPQEATTLREVFLSTRPELRGKRILLFLSRIHPKKGCDLLIRAFAGIASRDPRLHLVMAGPDETGWVDRLTEIAREAGIAQRISWPGMLRGEAKWGAFYAAEAFVLPSHQENFGIAVAEALGCGLPVLISNKVNIWREVVAYQAGCAADDTLIGTSALLNEWLGAAGERRRSMGDNARRLFREHFTVEAMAASLVDIVTSVAGAPSAVVGD